MSVQLLYRALTIFFIMALSGYGYYRYLNRTAIKSLPQLVYEEDPEITQGHTPVICTGLEELEFPASERADGSCPPHFAFIGAEDASVRNASGSPASIPLESVCCPLPAKDILTDEHIYNVEQECPSNHIATGQSALGCAERCFMRCTRINIERYSLGAKHQAVYWKRPGSYPSAGDGGAKQIILTDIPWAIRYGISRWAAEHAERGIEAWDSDGCSSVPFGALAVEKRSGGCGGLYFRHLYFRETQNAVRMFPDCSSVAGVVEREPTCIN